MLRMCVLTVFTDTDSSAAISGRDRFVGRYRSTFSSPGLSSSACSGARPNRAGRCSQRREAGEGGSAHSGRHGRTDNAREIASQSSICIDPSGRSAMICTVQPASPEILTRTSR